MSSDEPRPSPGGDAAMPRQSVRSPTGRPGEEAPGQVDVSVCIVTYQARDLLRDCLHSLYENTAIEGPVPAADHPGGGGNGLPSRRGLEFEVIVVDNGSRDGVAEMLRQEFPQIHFVENEGNAGYTRPMNQALRLGQGRYLLQLNPDTLILSGALDRLVAFMDEQPHIGICGPKVLNRDMTLQKPCRRGEPTPWAVITYFTGLSRLFPRSKLFGQYLMTYLDEDQAHPVDGVAGSCMMIRKAVVDQIGYLDERFFAYQEDADYCFRARQAGWQVYYNPEAQIVHYGGHGGSRVQPYRSIYEWHRSYFLYYRKNLARNYFFLFNWLYYGAMALKLALALAINFVRTEKFAGSRKP